MGIEGHLTQHQQTALNAAQGLFGTWGSGKLKTDLPDDEWLANLHSVCTDDCEWDFTGVKHPMFKVWKGAKDFKAWMKMLDDSEFPNMKPVFLPGAEATNQCVMQMFSDWKYKGAEIKMEDIFVFTERDGKVCKMKQLFGRADVIEKEICPKIPADNYGMTNYSANGLADDQKMALNAAQNMFMTWGMGKLKTHLPDAEWKANMLTVLTDDCEWDFSGVDHPMFKLWKGVDTFKPWMKFLDDSTFTGMKPTFLPGAEGTNQAIMQMNSGWRYKEGDMQLNDVFVITCRDGKICRMKQHWGNAAEIQMKICTQIPKDCYGMA